MSKEYNTNTKKVLLLTGARHGSHYFSNVLNANGIDFHGEIMNTNFCKIVLKELKTKLSKHNIELHDKDIEFISELRYKDEKMFFYKTFSFYDKLAFLNKKKYSGFRIFYDHLNVRELNSVFYESWNIKPSEIKYEKIKNKLNLMDVVDHVDKIVVLARDSKEVAFSFAQALNNNLWHDTYRNNKSENLILEENRINYINSFLFENFNFFKNIEELSKKQPDKFLFLNYDEFTTNAWDKVSTFLKIDINKSLCPFGKNKYDYDPFFNSHPSIKKTAETYNTIF